jgi:hypothetical protein
VLLSDGDDTSSLIEFDQVLDLAKRSEVVIYAIGLRAGEIARREFKEAEFVLKQLATETGGRRSSSPTRASCEDLPGHLGRALQPVRDRLLVGEPEARRRLAAGPGAAAAPEHHGAHQAGLLRSHRIVEPR